MKHFKWNDKTNLSVIIWDHSINAEFECPGISDKEIINNPYLVKYDSALMVICRVLSELIEIEEGKKHD